MKPSSTTSSSDPIIRMLERDEVQALLTGVDVSFCNVMTGPRDWDSPIAWAFQDVTDEWEDIFDDERGQTLDLPEQVRVQCVVVGHVPIFAFEATHPGRPRVEFALRGIEPSTRELIYQKELPLPMALLNKGIFGEALARMQAQAEAKILHDKTPDAQLPPIGTSTPRL